MNNECDKDRIIAAVDGELTHEEMALLKKHLESCEDCRKEYEEYSRMAHLCEALPMAEMPKDLVEDVLQGCEHNQVLEMEKHALRKWQPKPKRYKRWVSVAVAAAILVMVVYPFVRNSGPKDFITSIVASADEGVSALDLVYSFSPEQVEVLQAEKRALSDGFLLVTNIEKGTVRISMASADSMNLADPAKILDIPIRVKNGRNKEEYLRLESVRAYRPDGREIPATLEQISISSDRVTSELSTSRLHRQAGGFATLAPVHDSERRVRIS